MSSSPNVFEPRARAAIISLMNIPAGSQAGLTPGRKRGSQSKPSSSRCTSDSPCVPTSTVASSSLAYYTRLAKAVIAQSQKSCESAVFRPISSPARLSAPEPPAATSLSSVLGPNGTSLAASTLCPSSPSITCSTLATGETKGATTRNLLNRCSLRSARQAAERQPARKGGRTMALTSRKIFCHLKEPRSPSPSSSLLSETGAPDACLRQTERQIQLRDPETKTTTIIKDTANNLATSNNVDALEMGTQGEQLRLPRPSRVGRMSAYHAPPSSSVEAGIDAKMGQIKKPAPSTVAGCTVETAPTPTWESPLLSSTSSLSLSLSGARSVQGIQTPGVARGSSLKKRQLLSPEGGERKNCAEDQRSGKVWRTVSRRCHDPGPVNPSRNKCGTIKTTVPAPAMTDGLRRLNEIYNRAVDPQTGVTIDGYPDEATIRLRLAAAIDAQMAERKQRRLLAQRHDGRSHSTESLPS